MLGNDGEGNFPGLGFKWNCEVPHGLQFQIKLSPGTHNITIRSIDSMNALD